MGIYRQQFIPADPPSPGRYIVWQKGDDYSEWQSAEITGAGNWYTDDDTHAPLPLVHYYMDIGGIST